MAFMSGLTLITTLGFTWAYLFIKCIYFAFPLLYCGPLPCSLSSLLFFSEWVRPIYSSILTDMPTFVDLDAWLGLGHPGRPPKTPGQPLSSLPRTKPGASRLVPGGTLCRGSMGPQTPSDWGRQAAPTQPASGAQTPPVGSPDPLCWPPQHLAGRGGQGIGPWSGTTTIDQDPKPWPGKYCTRPGEYLTFGPIGSTYVGVRHSTYILA